MLAARTDAKRSSSRHTVPARPHLRRRRPFIAKDSGTIAHVESLCGLHLRRGRPLPDIARHHAR